MNSTIYTDRCLPEVSTKIKSELGFTIVTQLPENTWDLSKAIYILTDPTISLVIFNKINEITLMEAGILLFLYKKILITDPAIKEYDFLSKQVDYIDPTCNLNDPDNSFITWYNYTLGDIWKSY